MAIIGRRDNRSYAQVVSHTCGSNFTKNLYSVTDHVVCPNIQAKCDTARIDSTSKSRVIVTSPASFMHNNKGNISIKLNTGLDSVIVGKKSDTLSIGKATGCGFNATTSTDLYTVPITNRFPCSLSLTGVQLWMK